MKLLNTSITGLADYLGKTRQSLYYMRKHQPKQFELLYNGWLELCKSINQNKKVSK